eukprot:gb/GFBE01070763.1/.p1 GENE.gb/GFBE01070763.1/~~gb/GFBE01070763.1/.p1  ORF type:complete len:485 (+),score=88.85 gb/GFBE01070763.1/:1-1455(+)
MPEQGGGLAAKAQVCDRVKHMFEAYPRVTERQLVDVLRRCHVSESDSLQLLEHIKPHDDGTVSAACIFDFVFHGMPQVTKVTSGDHTLSCVEDSTYCRECGQERRSRLDVPVAQLEEDAASRLIGCREDLDVRCAKDDEETARLLDDDIESWISRAIGQERAAKTIAHQQALFLALRSADDYEAAQHAVQIVGVAESEASYLISEVINYVMEKKYKASQERWKFVTEMQMRDPPQRQFCPEHIDRDETYLDYLLVHASWVRPRFIQLCDALALIFNSAETTKELCENLRLNPEDFPLPLRTKALALHESDTRVVHVKHAPLKSRQRACEKSHEAWLEDDERYPHPKGQHCLTDMVRATFEFGDPFVLAIMFHALLKNFEVTRHVNRLCDEKPTQPPNVNMNIKIDGFIVEVQLQLVHISKIQDTLHKYYEILRYARSFDKETVLAGLAFPVFDPCSVLQGYEPPAHRNDALALVHRQCEDVSSA